MKRQIKRSMMEIKEREKKDDEKLFLQSHE